MKPCVFVIKSVTAEEDGSVVARLEKDEKKKAPKDGVPVAIDGPYYSATVPLDGDFKPGDKVHVRLEKATGADKDDNTPARPKSRLEAMKAGAMKAAKRKAKDDDEDEEYA